MQVLNSSVARPWKLEQNTSGQASRQALRASRLWKLEQNNVTKKGPFFGPQNVRKSRRAKMGLPSMSSPERGSQSRVPADLWANYAGTGRQSGDAGRAVPGDMPPGFCTQLGPGSGGRLGTVPVLPGDATRVRVCRRVLVSRALMVDLLLRLEVLIL